MLFVAGRKWVSREENERAKTEEFGSHNNV